MNVKKKITISVVTVTWNCVDNIKDCLDSVAQQTWPHREHVVIDGASQDGTLAILQSRRQQLSVLLSEPDDGIYDALNKGIACCSGDVIGFLHADDIYAHSNVLEEIAKVFLDPNISAVYGDLDYVKKDDFKKVVRHWKSSAFDPKKLNWGWMPPHPTLYVRKEWYDFIEGFDANFRISADYFSILKLFSQPEFRPKYLPGVMVKMRLGGQSNQSLKNILLKSYEDYAALRNSKFSSLGAFRVLVCKNLCKLVQFNLW